MDLSGIWLASSCVNQGQTAHFIGILKEMFNGGILHRVVVRIKDSTTHAGESYDCKSRQEQGKN